MGMYLISGLADRSTHTDENNVTRSACRMYDCFDCFRRRKLEDEADGTF